MSGVVPKIVTINPQDLAPRYVWLDEDGDQVSPVHKNFSTALHFVNGWQNRFAKLQKRWGEYSAENSHHFQSAYVSMTRSGKPPVQMRKVTIEISLVDLAPDEQSVVEAMLRTSS